MGSQDEDRIFLKVIPSQIEESSIRAAFAEFGDVTDVYIPRHQSGATKYGFIKFSDPSVIDSIVERQEIVCAGVSIPLERASRRPSNNYSAPPQQQYQQSYSEPAPKRHADRVFCKEVPMTINSDHMRTYWSQFGEIQDVYFPKDHHETNNPHRGICFISFHDNSAVNKALESSEHTINGSSVSANRADPKPQRDSGYGGKGGDYGGKGGGYGGKGGGYGHSAPMHHHAPQQYMPPQYQQPHYDAYQQAPPQYYPQQHQPMPHLSAPPMPEAHGLPPTAPTEAAPQMQQQYAAYMGEVQPAPAPAADPYAQPAYGAAYAQPAYGHPAPQYAQQAPGLMHGGGPAQSGGGVRNRVFVGGVQPEMQPDDMRHHFGQFGIVEDVYFPKGQDGKGRGFAYVRFSTEQEAGDAVARSPREINGIKIGEIRIAEPRPGGKGGGGGGPARGQHGGQRYAPY